MAERNEFNLIDLVHLAWLVAKDMIFHVHAGAQEGIIVLKRGKIVHASITKKNNRAGHQVFQEILTWKGVGEITTTELSGDYKPNITVSTKSLLQLAREEEKRAALSRKDP